MWIPFAICFIGLFISFLFRRNEYTNDINENINNLDQKMSKIELDINNRINQIDIKMTRMESIMIMKNIIPPELAFNDEVKE